ncbi:MAG: hypothetical protein COT16_03325 [Elusimicrobia bacterium CG08_land_8_20_14_0_20_44_26]|nr:MAG: hypothetical protein COT16_03325 [Elusimicrobia bacterium CG08_land_8_20_14_0_20_44_26]
MRNEKNKGAAKIMVLAAGRGTRLRPLTYRVPKPMIPIANKPALEHFFLNLKEQGFSDFMCNLYAFPEKIRDYFAEGEKLGINIKYSIERKLLGSAGGLKKVENYFKDSTFAVISGDGFTDMDLREVLKFHRKKKSFATMVLKEVDSALPFGFTRISSSGRIKKFIEKPRISTLTSPAANTGIYVFEPAALKLIPKDRFYDFGHDLWPKLLRLGYPIYGFETKAYWCDVGDLEAYRQTVFDVLDGKVKAHLDVSSKEKGVLLEKNVILGKNVKIIPPCLIGENTRVASGSRVGPYVSIGKNSKIGASVSVKNSIIWDNVLIDKNVRIKNCIIAYNAKIKESITLYGGAVISTEEEK